LRVYQERNGQETVLGYVYPGEIVGEIAIFKEGAPWRSAHVVSSGSSSLLVILAPIVRELSHKHPEIYQKIFHFIKNREASNMRKTEKTQK
jgi:CRP-like cAMP-binding protein